MRWTRWTLIVPLSCVLLLSGPARGVDRVWVGGSGNWLDTFHWDPTGVPVGGDRVFATATDSLNKIITFNDNRPIIPIYNALLIDESGPGSVFLRQPGGQLSALTMTVGVVGQASYEVQGGTAGFFAATVDTRGSLAVGTPARFSAGSFTQRGPVTVFGQFHADDYAQFAQRLFLGDGSNYTGVNFRQQGQGVGTADRTMQLTGSYIFNTGSFNVTPPTGQPIAGGVSCATFDYNAAGSFGGSVEVTQRLNLWVGNATILGSLVDRAPQLTINDDIALGVNQDATKIGGVVTQAGTFSTPLNGIIGRPSGTLRLAGGAQWTQTGGLNLGGDLIVGAGEGGGATYTLGAGEVRYPNGGLIVLGHLSDGSFVQNAGKVTATALVVGGAPTANFGAERGTYVKNGGELNLGSFGAIIVGRDGSAGGAFTQSAGTTSCGQLILNENATNQAVFTMTGGALTVADRTLSHGTYDQSGGAATFLDNFDGAGNVSVTGNATMGVLRLRQNSVHVGGTARIDPAGSSFGPPTHRVLALSFESGPGSAVRGTWNLAASDLVVDYTGPSPLSDVKRYLTSGYAGGSWNGTGLNSSVAVAQNRALGYAEASDVLGPAGGTFSGVFADPTSILVKYTRYGDANVDGIVNLNDFNRMAANFGGTNKTWAQGDFDYNGIVNLNDFNRLASNFGLSAAGPSVTPEDWAALANVVPEPTSAPLLFGVAASAATAARARRRRKTL